MSFRISSRVGSAVLSLAAALTVNAANSPATLDQHVGAYQYSATTVMHVTQEEGHLTARFTGDSAAAKLYARSDTEFAYESVDGHARIAFSAPQAVLMQNGQETLMPRIDAQRAAQIEAAVAQRVSAQSPSERSEAALRQLLSDLRAGRIDASLLSPQLVGALSQDLPKFQIRLAELGPSVSLRHKQVDAAGGDEYEVTHDRGVTDWSVVVDDHGVITAASVPF